MRNTNFATIVCGFIGLFGLHYILKKRYDIKKLTQRDIEESNKLIVTSPVYYDLTAPITENTVVFLGDPIFHKKQISSIGMGCCFNLSEISMGNHMGTHIDFPGHVIKSGKLSSNYSINDLIGDGVIIELPDELLSVSDQFLQGKDIRKNDFIFFKTRNSALSKQDLFTEKYVFIEPDAARALLNMKVRVVGIDYISVDSYKAHELPVHQILLSNNVLIVENLELHGIDPGRCRIFIFPLNIPDMDGLPARVVMTR